MSVDTVFTCSCGKSISKNDVTDFKDMLLCEECASEEEAQNSTAPNTESLAIALLDELERVDRGDGITKNVDLIHLTINEWRSAKADGS